MLLSKLVFSRLLRLSMILLTSETAVPFGKVLACGSIEEIGSSFIFSDENFSGRSE